MRCQMALLSMPIASRARANAQRRQLCVSAARRELARTVLQRESGGRIILGECSDDRPRASPPSAVGRHGEAIPEPDASKCCTQHQPRTYCVDDEARADAHKGLQDSRKPKPPGPASSPEAVVPQY